MLAPNVPDQAIMAQELKTLKGMCPLFLAMLVEQAKMNLITGNLELVSPVTGPIPQVLNSAKINIADHCVKCPKVLDHKPQAIVTLIEGDTTQFHPTIDILTSQSVNTVDVDF